MKNKNLFWLSLLLFVSCGGKPTLQLTLSGAAAFSDATVQDIVFIIENVPTSEGGLDQDNDGVPDVFVYPENCGGSIPAGCGFPVKSGAITVGDLPLNFQYKITVKLRNSSGVEVHKGEATFENKKNSAAVDVAVL